MADVTIGSNTYFSYASVEEADDYFLASTRWTTWNAADADTKGRALVTATRILDRQQWQGEPTDPAQENAFPRSGLTLDGQPVPSSAVPERVVLATMELAVLLIAGEEVEMVQNTSQKIASLSAGSVSISYFRGAEGIAQRFPQQIMELIGMWLLTASTAFKSGFISGFEGETAFNENLGRTRGL